MMPVNWLCVNGNVLVDGARTLTYLRRGLAGPEWEVKLRRDFVEESGYSDIYSDIYGADPFDPYNLACYCPQTADPAGYVSPEADPAPWYIASRPESAEFLGVLLTSLVDRPPQARSVTRYASGGARVGSLTPTERSAAFTATMVATSGRGMEYGRRWVSDILFGGLCDDEPGEVTFLPACPEDPDDDTKWRRYAQAGLIDGPTFTRADDQVGECYVTNVSWQIAAGVPWLLSEPEQIDSVNGLAEESIERHTSASWEIDCDEWNGDVGVLIQFQMGADDNVRLVDVRAYPLPEDAECPIPGSPSPCYQHTVSLGHSAALEINGAEEEMTYWNPTTKQPGPGWQRVTFDGQWNWLTVPPCSRVCLTVRNGGGPDDVGVKVFRVVREA